MCLWKGKNKLKRGRGWPISLKNLSLVSWKTNVYNTRALEKIRLFYGCIKDEIAKHFTRDKILLELDSLVLTTIENCLRRNAPGFPPVDCIYFKRDFCDIFCVNYCWQDLPSCIKTVILHPVTVWPEKNRQMSINLPKNDFTRKMKDFNTSTKIAWEYGRFGQINCCQRL